MGTSIYHVYSQLPHIQSDYNTTFSISHINIQYSIQRSPSQHPPSHHPSTSPRNTSPSRLLPRLLLVPPQLPSPRSRPSPQPPFCNLQPVLQPATAWQICPPKSLHVIAAPSHWPAPGVGEESEGARRRGRERHRRRRGSPCLICARVCTRHCCGKGEEQ